MSKETEIKSFLKTLYYGGWMKGTISGTYPKEDETKKIDAVYELIKDWLS